MRDALLTVSVATVALFGVATVQAQAPASPANQTITVAGCAQKEVDVLKHSPMMGSVGMSDEFVLTHATLKQSGEPSRPSESAEKAPEATGTSGSAADFGKIYRVTGDKEQELKNYTGQRIEIVGRFKHEEDARRELAPSGGAQASRTTGEPTAANTPEITIESIRAISSTCNSK